MLDSGDTRSARRLAEQTIATLEATGADWVVSPAASCVVAMVHEYPDLFAGDPAWQERTRRLAERTVDVVTFLDRVAKVQRDVSAAARAHGGTAPRTVYHPFCQTRTLLHADGATRRILTEVCGVELVALPEADVCCGFGGATSIGAPEVGRTVATRKLRNVDSTGAAVLLTDNPGCLMHLAGASAASGRALQVRHVVDVIAEQLCDTTSKQPRSVKV
jgi:Fe-S oxidoreductase